MNSVPLQKPVGSPVNLKLRGGVSEPNDWPWLYEIKYVDGTFCAANQIRPGLLVTGMM